MYRPGFPCHTMAGRFAEPATLRRERCGVDARTRADECNRVVRTGTRRPDTTPPGTQSFGTQPYCRLEAKISTYWHSWLRSQPANHQLGCVPHFDQSVDGASIEGLSLRSLVRCVLGRPRERGT